MLRQLEYLNTVHVQVYGMGSYVYVLQEVPMVAPTVNSAAKMDPGDETELKRPMTSEQNGNDVTGL